jgi:hypothetical protein
MQDVSIVLENRPGALAEMGEALERAGVSIEGGLFAVMERLIQPTFRELASRLTLDTGIIIHQNG